MVWFKVDDKFHSHPKTSNVSLAAIGLWAVAGAWCGDHLTDGRVPEHVAQLLSRGATGLVDELVAAGLWARTRDGYRFHQWNADGNGSKRNPTRKEVEEERRKKAEAGKKGGLASGKVRSKRQARAKAGASGVLDDSLNPRPDPPPSTKEDRGDARPRFAQGAAGAPPNPDGHSPPNGEAPVDLAALRQQLQSAARKVRGRTA